MKFNTENPIENNVYIFIVDPPEINVGEEVVATSENYDAKLKCIVHAEPKAAVHWLKNNQSILHSEHLVISQEGHDHYLEIKKVMIADFGKYTCVANNSQGFEVSKIIELTGMYILVQCTRVIYNILEYMKIPHIRLLF